MSQVIEKQDKKLAMCTKRIARSGSSIVYVQVNANMKGKKQVCILTVKSLT